MAKDNWRDDIDRKLLGTLDEEGVGRFMDIATHALSINPGGDHQLRAQFVGEVCECVLWGLTSEYARLSKKKLRVYHSVVLKDLKNLNGSMRTELDSVIVSPYFIATIECKSYKGKVRFEEEGTLVRGDNRVNVWSQSNLHHKHLTNYAQQLLKKGIGVPKPPVLQSAFLFSDAKMQDNRHQFYKDAMPVLTASTLIDYYSSLFAKYKTPIYDYERACRIFDTCSRSKKLHAQHAKYVGY